MNKPSDKMEFVEATVTVHQNLADAVSNYINENISAGMAIEDSPNGDFVSIKFYPTGKSMDFRPALKTYLSQIVSANRLPEPSLVERTIQSQDWEENYRKSIKPVQVGNDIIIRPPWADKPGLFKFDIIIEPKMAFGTGHHETTRACLGLILKYFRPRQRLLDFGCGSGVLSILAAKLEAGFVKAVDYDPIAIENAVENFEINNINTGFELVEGSIEKVADDKPYDIVCANLSKSDLVANMSELKRLTAEHGYLILSGLLNIDQKDIEDSMAAARLKIEEFIPDGEWLTYCLKK